MSPTDYARTPYAEQNRQAKSLMLAATAWDRGISGGDLAAMDPVARRALAREVGVNEPKDPGDTWPMVVDLLDKKESWAASHPGDPRAARADLNIIPPGSSEAAPDLNTVIPKGWEALVKAWPPLQRPDAQCVVCKGPAVTATAGTWRCGAHPPRPGEWGAALNWTPRVPPTGCGHGRCYCTRCPHYSTL